MRTFATDQENEYKYQMDVHLGNVAQKRPLSYLVNNFAKYTRKQELSRLLVRHELFKEILNVKGSIVECGVLSGNGLMTWAQLSAIYEPVAFFRRIYGFDTFEGFPNVSAEDINFDNPKIGDEKDECYADLKRCVELFDMNRSLSQFQKVSLIKGDFMQTGDQFLRQNPHVLVALLFLDFDIYEPTKKALELFLPRMPKGAILAFDEINNEMWPGETTALLETLNIRDLRIQKFPYDPNISYIVL